jgi:uncharacterized coiled-coil protein SlyX
MRKGIWVMRSIQHKKNRWLISTAFIFVFASMNTVAYADGGQPIANTAANSVEMRLTELERRLKDQDSVIAKQASLIDEQRAALERQKAETTGMLVELAKRDTGPQLANEYAKNNNGDFGREYGRTDGQYRSQYAAYQDNAAKPSAPAQQQVANGERPKSEKAVDQLLLDQGGVLLPAGKLQIEPGIDYTSISSDNVNISGFSIFNAIVIGTIRVDDVSRDILTGALSLRYGLHNRVQMDARIPFVYRNDSETTGIGTGDAMTRSTKGYGLGDISVTASYQPFVARGWRPATILRLQGEFATGKSAFEIPRMPAEEGSPEQILTRAPTGSGFYTLSPGVNFVWPTDPVVLFAGGSFNYSLKRRFAGFGLVEPGSGFEYYAGINLSINELVSLNFSVLNKHRFNTKLNGVTLPGSSSNDARLTLGASIGLTDRISLVLSSSNGLTDESPDFTFSARLPIAF